MKSLITLSLLAFNLNAFSASLFVFKKNVNPGNVLHYKANTENCTLKSPSVSAYWVMGEENGQIEGLTAKEVEFLKPKISYTKETEADFTIGAIEELEGKLTDKDVKVRMVDCVAKAFLEINGKEVEIKEIKLNLSSFMAVKDVTISGKAASGETVRKIIEN